MIIFSYGQVKGSFLAWNFQGDEAEQGIQQDFFDNPSLYVCQSSLKRSGMSFFLCMWRNVSGIFTGLLKQILHTYFKYISNKH